jgi:hypothetical protein
MRIVIVAAVVFLPTLAVAEVSLFKPIGPYTYMASFNPLTASSMVEYARESSEDRSFWAMLKKIKDRERISLPGVADFYPPNTNGEKPTPGLPQFGFYVAMRRETVVIAGRYPDELKWSHRRPEFRKDLTLLPGLRDENDKPQLPSLSISLIDDTWSLQHDTTVGLFYSPNILQNISLPLLKGYKINVRLNIAAKSLTTGIGFIQCKIPFPPH